MRAFSLGDARALRALFVDAGFRDVRIEAVRRQRSVPSVDEFIAMTVMGASAAVPALAEATDEERADAIREIREEIAPEFEAVRVSEKLAYPMESHILVAVA